MKGKVFSKNAASCFGVLLLLMAACLPFVAHADSSSADAALTSARSKLIECFNAAKAAETAGANISELTNTLNEAGSMLSKAEFSYSSSNFPESENEAAQSQNILSNFISQADSLRNAASQRQNTDFLLNFVGSIAGTIAVIVSSVAVWVFLRRRYERVGVKQGESPAI